MNTHRLDPLKKPHPLEAFSVCDIESIKWTQFLCIGLTDGTCFDYFTSLSIFLDVIRDRKTKTCFAHFGGIFDFMFILEACIKRRDIKIESLIPRGSGILSFDIEFKCGHRCRFSDSSALLPFSLKTITESFGVAHKKQDFDVSRITRITPKLLEYLEHDCRGLHESLGKFWGWSHLSGSGAASTTAGQALRVFRKGLERPIYSPGDDIQNFARKSYLGGRTEIFRPLHEGPAKLYCYDVNSLYPYAMLGDFPTGKTRWVYEFERTKLGIYHARVTVPEMPVPPLGVVRDGKFIFPTGRFDGYWTSIELEYAKRLGVTFDIIEGVCFERREPIFKSYVENLYAIRIAAVKGSLDEIMAKLMLNSLYGRFGMNPEKENLVFEPGELGELHYEINIDGVNYGLWKNPVHLDSFYNVSIASFVTAYARVHMHKIFQSLGETLYYTDTDSVFTTTRLPVSNSLGALKLESVTDSAVFLLPKTYVLKGADFKVAMKGFDKKKIGKFTYDDFRLALDGDIKRLKIDIEPKFARLKTALKSKKFITMTKATTKEIKSAYSKRTVIRTGKMFSTVPLILKEF